MPDWRARVVERLRGAGIAADADAALVQELAHHLEDRYRECLAIGMIDADAQAAASAELDGHERLAAEIARARRVASAVTVMPIGAPSTPGAGPGGVIAGLWQDLRYAARVLRRSPGFTTAAVLTVALTTGPTTAMLGIADFLLFRPLPQVTEPHRLATVNFGVPGDGGGYRVSRISYAHTANLVQASPSVLGMAGWQSSDVSVGTDGAEPTVREAEFVSANFFDVLGVRLVAGRPFRADEDATPGGETVTILSERLARVLFPEGRTLDRVVRVNGHAFTVVGVAPAAFPGTAIQQPVDLWIPGLTYPRVSHQAHERWTFAPDRGPFYRFVARLAPGATFDQAALELRTAALALSRTTPDADKFSTVQPMLHAVVGVEPERLDRLRDFVQPLIAIGLVLVGLGAANLTNLFVFRSVRRAPETALRRALGATTGRLGRFPLFEAVIVAVTGGLLGLALVVVLQRAIGGTIITGVGAIDLPVDWRVAAMASALSLVVGTVLGVAPARLAAKATLLGTIAAGTRTSGPATRRLRLSLAVVQVALSLTLVVGALLFIATLRNLRGTEAGFDATGVTRFSLGFRQQGYSPARATQLLRDLTDSLRRARPGDQVAYGDSVPMRGLGLHRDVFAGGATRERAIEAPTVEVSPDYFAVIGIELAAGRGFTAEEVAGTGPEPGVVVSEALARQLYGRTDVVGQPVVFTAILSVPEHAAPIVGVARDVKWTDLTADAPALLFTPRHRMFTVNNVVAVRSTDAPAATLARIRGTVAALDPSLPVLNAGALGELTELRLGEQRLFGRVLTALAAIGFLLAAVGIHGLVSQTVIERTREFGVRMAIGATRGQIVTLVLRSAAVIIAIGAPAGIALAYGGSRLLASRLYGVTPGEPAVYVAGVVALLGVVITASLAPARIASRANPVDVLRSE